MSVGSVRPSASEKSTADDALVASLEARLRDKEQDIVLAAQVGQSLLLEIDKLKQRLGRFEEAEAASKKNATPTPNYQRRTGKRGSPSTSPLGGSPLEDGYHGNSSPPLAATSGTSISTPKPLSKFRSSMTPANGSNFSTPKTSRRGLMMKQSSGSTPTLSSSALFSGKKGLSTSGNNGSTWRTVVSQSPSTESLFSLDSTGGGHPAANAFNAAQLDAALLSQTRSLSWKVADLEKLITELREQLAAAKALTKSSKKQADALAARETQLNETAWNLEVLNQTLQDRVSVLENSHSKSATSVKALEKSKLALQAHIETLHQQEARLLSLNETLTLKMDADRLKFKRELEEARMQLQAAGETAKDSGMSSYTPLRISFPSNMGEMDTVPGQPPSSGLPPSPSKKLRPPSSSVAFDESLSSALKESQRRIEMLKENESNLEMEKDALMKDLETYQIRIRELEEELLEGNVSPHQTDAAQQTSTQISEISISSDAQLLLLQQDDSHPTYSLCQSKGLQVPSILSSKPPEYWEFLITRTDVKEKADVSTEIDAESMVSEPVSETTNEFLRHRFSSQATDAELLYFGGGQSKVESLTYTMIGTWFLKYNRHNKNPKLRYFWINPYTRTLHWSEYSPSQGRSRAGSRSGMFTCTRVS